MYNKKILIFNRNDIEGGAARATLRLIKSLHKRNVYLTYIVDKRDSDLTFIKSHSSLLYKLFVLVKPHLDIAPLKIFYKKNKHDTWGLGWFPFFFRFKELLNNSNYIVHLHWISFGFIPLIYLPKIKKNFFWTMHDMWAMTGGCHYSGNCDNYKSHCQFCPQLKSKFKFDLSFISFKFKKFIVQNSNVTIVCCSNWLAGEFRKSPIFKNKKIVVIPNAIDTNIYQNFPTLDARKIIGLPNDKKLILISALSAVDDTRKGFKFLIDAIEILKNNYTDYFNQIELIVLGSSNSQLSVDGLKIHFLGKINDDLLMPIIYSSSDLSVAPSIQENLSNSVMESISCGTPVVAFNIGGMPDMIKPGITGELANSIDSIELAKSIITVLKNGKEYYSTNCRNYVLNNYSEEIISQRHLDLYFSKDHI